MRDEDSGGFTLQELVGIFSARGAKSTLPRTARDTGKIFNATQLREAGYSAKELQLVGFSWAELKQAEFSAAGLKDAGATAKELDLAGMTREQLLAGGFTEEELASLPSRKDAETPAKANKKGSWLTPSKRAQSPTSKTQPVVV